MDVEPDSDQQTLVDPVALAAEIGRWLDRIERAPPDREAVRACVLDRAQGPWLARLAALVRANPR